MRKEKWRIIRNLELSSSAALVFLFLIDFPFSTYRDISHYTRLSKTTLIKATQELLSKKLIREYWLGGRKYLYTITWTIDLKKLPFRPLPMHDYLIIKEEKWGGAIDELTTKEKGGEPHGSDPPD